jgi:hypothetical protein
MELVRALGDEIYHFYRACTVTYFVSFEKNVNIIKWAKRESLNKSSARLGMSCVGFGFCRLIKVWRIGLIVIVLV